MKEKSKVQIPKRGLNHKTIFAAAAITIIVISAVYAYSLSIHQTTATKAAIIDQLGSSKLSAAIREENQTFIQDATNLLLRRFISVDYYQDNATIDEYMHLASSGYAMIIWRGHSALDLNGQYVALASTNKYPFVDLNGFLEDGRLTLCNVTTDPTQSLFFGITPTFISQVMDGRFQNTVIFLMSCNGLNPGYLKTAQAFREKGAKVIISWDNWITGYDNDGAAELLLQSLITQNNSISQAVSKIPTYVSDFGSARLRFYPATPETGNYVIPDYTQTQGSYTYSTATSNSANRLGKLSETERTRVHQPLETT